MLKDKDPPEAVLLAGIHHLWYRHANLKRSQSWRENEAPQDQWDKRTLSDHGCKGQPFPYAVDQELYREGPWHSLPFPGFREMGGSF